MNQVATSASQSTLADAISTDLSLFSGQILLMNQDDLLSEYIKVPSKRIVGGIFVVPRLVQGITSMLEDFRRLHASAASDC